MTLFWVAAFFLILLMVAGRRPRRYSPLLVPADQPALPARLDFTLPAIPAPSVTDESDDAYVNNSAEDSSIDSHRFESLPPLSPMAPLEPIPPIER